MISKGYEQELFKRLPPRRHMYMYGLNNKGEKRQVTVLGKEHEYSLNIWNAVRTTYQVGRSERILFWIERKGDSACGFLRASPLGLSLLHVLQLPFDDIEATLPDHHMNPLFDLLRKCSCSHIPDPSTLHDWRWEMDDKAQILLVSLNAVVHDLREGWRSTELQNALETARRRSDKRWKRIKDLVSETFEDCASVLPIRIDLHFLMAEADYPFVPPVSAVEAHEFMVKMERYLREHHPLLRYAWAREYGTETGFHFHLLVLLNGHIAQEGISTAKLIGEHWQQKITEGRGRYFNCNAHEYKTPVLGRIHFSNKLAITALLEESSWYLAKTDIWMQYKGAGRSFATSRRYKQRSPGGAKRKLSA
ncbi:MAG: inovirus Gp2 family protein [Cytophagaceae bacterium]|nr:MAG: inovirus Gp2 family protein [Cytophagaceae bacterium]